MAVLKFKNYSDIRGVDLSASLISDNHVSDALNMYIGKDGVLQKRPGWRVLKDFNTPINGMYLWKSKHGAPSLFIHAGTSLYWTMFVPQLRHFDVASGDVPFYRDSTDIPGTSDLINMLGVINGTATALPWQVRNMDINGDGRVDNEDFYLLQCIIHNGGTYGVLASDYTLIKKSDNTSFGLRNSKSTMFDADGYLYILDGNGYYRVCEETEDTSADVTNNIPSATVVKKYYAERVAGYVPTTGVRGHYEYKEPETEFKTGETVVEKQTVTAPNDSPVVASFAAVGSMVGDVVITFQVNQTVIVNEQQMDAKDGCVDIGIYELTDEGGRIDVTGATAGDILKLFIKKPDSEVTVVAEPGGEGNRGEWKGCEQDEERNLINPTQINTFAADGIHYAYYLTENDSRVDKVEILKKTRCKRVNGEDVPTQDEIDVVPATGRSPVTNIYYYVKYIWTTVEATDPPQPNDTPNVLLKYYVTQASSTTPIHAGISYTTKITFTQLVEPHDDGIDNIRVTFTPHRYSTSYDAGKDRSSIEKCSIVTKYGYYNNNRIFVSGNPEYRNKDWMSGVDDPTYFPENGWTKVGSDSTAIKAYLHYGENLMILKEEGSDATVYIRSAQLTEDNDVLFPVKQGAKGTGAAAKATGTLGDDPLFLTKHGVYAVESTLAENRTIIPSRSAYIDRVLKQEITEESIVCVHGDYFILCMPSSGKCYVADARYYENGGYNWFIWNNIYANCMLSSYLLLFGTQGGEVCVFNTDWNTSRKYSDGAVLNGEPTKFDASYSDGDPIEAYVVTKDDDLGFADYKKTILNRQAVITVKPELMSSVGITVKTDRGSYFVEQILTDDEAVIPIRHRMKWFDRIQTKVENDKLHEGLSLLEIQYRYTPQTNRSSYGD